MAKKRIRFFLDMLLFQGAIFSIFDECFFYSLYRGATMRESRFILCALVIGAVVIATISKDPPEFECKDMLLGFLPYCIYYMGSIYRYYPKVVIVSCVMVLLYLALAVVAWKTDRHAHTRNPQVRKKYRQKAAKLAECGVTYILIFTLVGTEFVTTFADKLPSIRRNQTVQELRQSHAYELSKDDEVLFNLKDSVWRGLSDDEKIATLQHVAEIEQVYLGIPSENVLSVKKRILAPQTLGQFKDFTYEIEIQTDHLRDDSSSYVVHTLLHECHHALTRKEIELYENLPEKYKSLFLFRDIVQYQKEEKNYAENGPEYYAQLLEIDADAYADDRIKSYFAFFN